MDDPVSKQADNREGMVLPNSVDIDLDGQGSDHTTGFPHSMPSAHDFSLLLGEVGITHNSDVVVYDTRGIYSAARVRFTHGCIGLLSTTQKIKIGRAHV